MDTEKFKDSVMSSNFNFLTDTGDFLLEDVQLVFVMPPLFNDVHKYFRGKL